MRERGEERGFVQQVPGARQQQLAGAGQLQVAVGAHEQLHPQRFLDGPYVHAGGGLADVQALGGAGQVLLGGDRDEGSQLDKVY
ncbi:hypothetical protein GCM10023144_38030 [Pigmentiphaga soli]|uniref:Uncharacterized protein n=1 Tax=Pigmentiphaga soli TaxID=1007095 RepID=A0ABP8HI26_9BURK